MFKDDLNKWVFTDKTGTILCEEDDRYFKQKYAKQLQNNMNMNMNMSNPKMNNSSIGSSSSSTISRIKRKSRNPCRVIWNEEFCRMPPLLNSRSISQYSLQTPADTPRAIHNDGQFVRGVNITTAVSSVSSVSSQNENLQTRLSMVNMINKLNRGHNVPIQGFSDLYLFEKVSLLFYFFLLL